MLSLVSSSQKGHLVSEVNSEMKEMGKTRTIENKSSHEKSSTFQEYFHSTLNEIEASETDL